jgi:oligoendopeptidase F
MVQVDPSIGAGHAWGAMMKGNKARLRTRIGENGMDYKGYNIAVHEFGHNVEQTITMNDVDYWMLNGVPNNAFTEAVAFMFQKRDLELLGLKSNAPETEAMLTLDDFWSCYEIMGVALVDMAVWEWMYKNPDATPEQLKNAVIEKAKNVWNSYYAGIMGGKDETILAIYSHMIDYPLYLSYYPIGHLISFQVEQAMKGKNFADEMERMYTQGRIVPQIWMKKAVGSEISTKPLLNAVDQALEIMK